MGKVLVCMHMADALLSPAVGIAMDAVSVAAVGFSVSRINKDALSDKKIPIMGVGAALVFAGQMINFTIPMTGSSGHIGGGLLLAGLLGGAPAFLSVTAVLIIQCLFFADGGLLALGCNIFNLGVIPCLVVYPLLFKPMLRAGASRGRLSAASVASAVAGLETGAFCVVAQTFLSGVTTLPFGAFLALMLPIHLAIGLVEGLVTAAVLCFVRGARPEIIDSALNGERLRGISTGKVVAALALSAVVAGGALSLFASTDPDGLEWAVGKAAAAEITAEGPLYDGAAEIQGQTAFLPDYALPADPENPAGTSLAGVVGALVTFGLAGAAGLIISLAKRRRAGANG